MVESDCFEDELYDPVDEVCYLACEADGTCEDEGLLSWVGSLIGDLVGGGFAMGEDESEGFISYEVVGNEISNPEVGEAFDDETADFQEDTNTHILMWRAFTQLIPQDQRTQITRYTIFTDGEGETLAYVSPNDEDPLTWLIAMDIVDADDEKEQTYTLIHEFAHVLTLNNNQVPFDAEAYADEGAAEESAVACPTFFTGEGCSNSDSYINQFYAQFWQPLAGARATIDQTDPDAIYAFYEEFQDQFVTDYAATNPGEDIAESFTFFVLNPKPNGDTIAEEKQLFFYDFPELVALRTEIQARAYAASRRSE